MLMRLYCFYVFCYRHITDNNTGNTSMKKIVLSCLITLLSVTIAYTISFAAKKDDDTPFKKGVKYFYQQKFEIAELLFQEELKNNPENAMAYSYLGDIFLYKKRYDGALQLYIKALELNPKSAEDAFRIGQVYYYKKQPEEALAYFKKAFSLNPQLKFAYYHIGLTYLMLLRDKEKTIESWEKFLAIAPEDPQYEKIKRVIELLKDPKFVLPPPGSDVSIEEALHLGGIILDDVQREAQDKKAGHETKKTKNKLEEIYRDDEL